MYQEAEGWGGKGDIFRETFRAPALSLGVIFREN